MTKSEYLSDYSSDALDESKKQRLALEQAHDIRKFEIDLYWKRGTYFWTFNAAAFAGFFLLEKNSSPSNLVIIGCLGFIFSISWYFVNRGSSVWQNNWENHIDLLEDEITGPLYKSVIRKTDYKFRDFSGPYPFSPSKINNLLSLIVSIAWVGLTLKSAFSKPVTWSTNGWVLAAIGIFTIAAIVFLYAFGRTKTDTAAREIKVEKRNYA